MRKQQFAFRRDTSYGESDFEPVIICPWLSYKMPHQAMMRLRNKCQSRNSGVDQTTTRCCTAASRTGL